MVINEELVNSWHKPILISGKTNIDTNHLFHRADILSLSAVMNIHFVELASIISGKKRKVLRNGLEDD